MRWRKLLLYSKSVERPENYPISQQIRRCFRVDHWAWVGGYGHKIHRKTCCTTLGITLPWAKSLQGKRVRRKVKAGPEKDRQQREGHRGRHGVGGSSSEAQYHLYQVFNKTKYETGACGMKSVLWFVISELFSSLKAPLPTVRPIAKGHSESCKCNTA